MADAAPPQGQHHRPSGEPMEAETLHAISVDRELIPLHKAQTLAKTNTSPLPCRECYHCVSANWHINKPRVCTVHCRMLSASVVLADELMAVLAVLDETAAERDH